MVPPKTHVNLVTFASATFEDTPKATELRLESKDKLRDDLDENIQQYEAVSNVCFICGLKKVLDASGTNKHSPSTAVVIAYESSLANTKSSDVTEVIQKHPNIILHLIFVEDTETDFVEPELIKAIEETTGRIYRIKKEPVFMITQLNMGLQEAFKNALNIEDETIVVYKKVYINETSDITDTFLTPMGASGRLLYMLLCSNLGVIRIVNGTCSDWDPESDTYKCKRELDLDEDTLHSWKFDYKNIARNQAVTCSSFAMLKFESPSLNYVTVRGWLSENEITPGRNALIIYAEVLGRKEQNVRVEATISGPGLDNFKLELRDNGNGDPDIVKGDNIHSRYFSSFKDKGTYTVEISIESGDLKENEMNEKHECETAKFLQTKMIGSFSVTQLPPEEDILPPNRIADLEVISIDNDRRSVLLKWTAPGDDYDFGRASKYLIKISKYWMDLLDFTFYEKGDNMLKQLHEYLPASSGFSENISFEWLNDYSGTYYIALRAADKNNNEAKISNIVQIYIQEPENSLKNLTTLIESGKFNLSTTFSSIDIYNFTTKSTEGSNFSSPDSTTVANVNITPVIINKTKDGFFIEKEMAVIIFSAAGSGLLFLIIINIIICFCCFRKKKSKKPKKLSREASLRPPYNLNIAYSHGSESSLDTRDEVANSVSTLPDENSSYFHQQGRIKSQKLYTYHTNKSLTQEESNNRKTDLGFKLVQAMPAYATTSLSRFETNKKFDEEHESLNAKSTSKLEKPLTNDSTHIYSLGLV